MQLIRKGPFGSCFPQSVLRFHFQSMDRMAVQVKKKKKKKKKHKVPTLSNRQKEF